MKISELEKKLKKAKDACGDVEVVIRNDYGNQKDDIRVSYNANNNSLYLYVLGNEYLQLDYEVPHFITENCKYYFTLGKSKYCGDYHECIYCVYNKDV